MLLQLWLAEARRAQPPLRPSRQLVIPRRSSPFQFGLGVAAGHPMEISGRVYVNPQIDRSIID